MGIRSKSCHVWAHAAQCVGSAPLGVPMSRRNRQATRRAVSKRQRQQLLPREVEREPDPQQRPA
ncbi:hypothetical protein GCM10017781_01500 [Deinococcus metalli]|uniref:Uncharacterized protein n=2 Tax=Deinococcus metalli TaxID=1141878 RepID=A0ABQ3JHV2_9DEIO|nr:hypothetical protein GCM10017781_01500 [Deinococcus metalli]